MSKTQGSKAEFNYKGAAKLAVCEFLGNDINGNGRYRVVVIIDNKVYTASGKGYYRSYETSNGDTLRDVKVAIRRMKSGKYRLDDME